jgi:hypothetical protein
VTGEHPEWPSGAPAEASSWPKGRGYSPLAAVVDGAGRPVIEGAINLSDRGHRGAVSGTVHSNVRWT